MDNLRILNQAEIERYNRLLNNAAIKNPKDLLVGSSLEHRYIMLTLMFNRAKKEANILIENFSSAITNQIYNDYISSIEEALKRGINVNYLTLEHNVHETNEFQLLRQFKGNKNLTIKSINSVPDSLTSRGECYNKKYTFETFDDKAYRFEIAKTNFAALGSFDNRKETCPLIKIFNTLKKNHSEPIKL